MTSLPVVVWLLPGLAGLTLWVLPSGSRWRPLVARLAACAQLVVAGALLSATRHGAVLGVELGDWAGPFGIVFAADRLSGLFVTLQAILLVTTVWVLRPGAHGRVAVDRALPLLFLLTFGLSGAFLTGDLFNLFVAFEVVLLASYLLLQVPGNDRSLRAALPNVAVNLVASIFFFSAVGLLYGQFGTVNLADLARAVSSTPPTPMLTVSGGLLVVAFGIKAGLVPVLFWLPATYPTLSGPVAALFAGMMTKLGVFALLRTAPLLLTGTVLPEVLVVVGSASALLGVLAALSQYEVRRLLGFHIVSQVGYMVLGLGLMTVGAVGAAIFYLTHHILVKAGLFLVADELERRSGTRDLRAMQPGRAHAGGLALLFLLGAASLAGLPPFSGFFAKVGLFRATIEVGSWSTLAVLVAASFFTLVSMLKIWRLAFGGGAAKAAESAVGSGAPSLLPLVVLALVSLLIAFAAGPVWELAEATARQLLDTGGYSDAVLGAASQSSALEGLR